MGVMVTDVFPVRVLDTILFDNKTVYSSLTTPPLKYISTVRFWTTPGKLHGHFSRFGVWMHKVPTGLALEYSQAAAALCLVDLRV
jgi:hypothetical protein